MPQNDEPRNRIARTLDFLRRRFTSREILVGSICLGLSGVLAGLLGWGLEDWRLVWPDRTDREMVVKPLHLAHTMAWWSLLGKSLLFLLLGLTVRQWLGRLPPLPAAPPAGMPVQGAGNIPRWWWIAALGVVIVVAAGLRYPRMDLSLYNDEVYGFERYVSGRFAADAGTGEPALKRVPWHETWWGNRLGNNFPLYSATARALHDGWSRLTGAEPGEVSEWALRLPALLGGLLSIALTAIWLRAAGRPRAALAAAVVLAFHPAHIRYSTEARGYGMAFVGVVLVAWLLWRAIREDRWPLWAGYGLSQVYLLLTYPGAIYWVAVLNLGVFAWLLAATWRGAPPAIDAPRGRQMLGRWLGVNAVAASLFGTVCFPQIFQAHLAHSDPDYMRGAMPLGWWRDVGAFLFWGVRWSGGDVDLAHMPGLSHWPVGLATLSLGLPLLVWTCLLARSPDRGTLWWITLASVPVSVALAWAHNASRGVFMHHWYAVHLVPLLIIFTIAGLAHPVWTPRLRPRPVPRVWLLGGTAALAIWLSLSLIHWSTIGWHSKEPLRHVIETARGAVYPHYLSGDHQKILLAGFYSNANAYDPHLIVVQHPEDLEHLIHRARSEDLPLYITHGYLQQAQRSHPALIEMLYQSDRFRLVDRFDGLGGNQFAHYLLEWDERPAAP